MSTRKDRRPTALPLEVLQRIDEVCARFEAAWKSEHQPAIEDYLGSTEGEERSQLRHELQMICEQRGRLSAKKPSIEEFIRVLDRSGLMTTAEAHRFLESLSFAERPNTAKGFARILFRAGKLTEAQVRAIYHGRVPGPIVGDDVAPDRTQHGGNVWKGDAVRSAESGSKSSDPQPLQLKLDVIAGPHQGRSFRCMGHENFLVGRSNRAHFRLPHADKFFSRLHFMIETNLPCCRLFDMNSTNGTTVNGKQVASVDLHNGDQIQGGDTVIKVSLLGDWTEAHEVAAPPGIEMSAAASPVSEGTMTYQPGLGAPTAVTESVPQAGTNMDSPCIPGYAVLQELGRGGMGVVYLARSHAEQQPVAIKTIRPAVAVSAGEVERFLREVEVLKQLDHPKIVGFRDSGKSGGLLYFVMEYVPGMTAAAMVKKHGPLPVDQAVNILAQTLEALQHAHDRGFVHRDVKPANLLVTNGGECKLADFGLARAYYASSMSGLTMMGQVGGTLPYMPPEQITDYRHVKPQTDQYAAAATLYYLLTGSYVFDFGNLSSCARLTKILTEEPVPIFLRKADLPKRLAEVVHRAISREVKDRFGNCADLRSAILPFA